MRPGEECPLTGCSTPNAVADDLVGDAHDLLMAADRPPQRQEPTAAVLPLSFAGQTNGALRPQVGTPPAGEGECLAKGRPFALRCRAETEGTVHQSVDHLGAALGDFAVYRRTQPPELFGWALARRVPLPRQKKRGVEGWPKGRKMLFTPLLSAKGIGNASLSDRKKVRTHGRSIDRLDAALGDPATVATACPSKLFD